MLKSKTSLVATLGDFPLFIYTLFGGFLVRQLMTLLRIDDLIDALSIQRLSAAAMEFLIVASYSPSPTDATFATCFAAVVMSPGSRGIHSSARWMMGGSSWPWTRAPGAC